MKSSRSDRPAHPGASGIGEAAANLSSIYVQETIVDFGTPAVDDQDPGYGECLTETKTHQSSEWTRHKSDAQKLARNLDRAKGFDYAGQVSRCATELNLYQYPDSDSWKVRPWQTCKKRWCPVCSWVKSQKRWLLASERMPGLIDSVGEPLRWRLLTLTVRNCEASELRSLTRDMLKGFRKLTQHQSWDALGWIRALEVTHNHDARTFHPHVHCLMAGPAMNPRIEQSEWVEKWRRAMRLDYLPVVDVRAVNKRTGAGKFSDALGGLQEVAKYTLKPANLKDASAVDLVMAIEGLSGLRLSEGGGFLRGVFAERSDEENEGREEDAGKARGRFDWRVSSKRYRRWVAE